MTKTRALTWVVILAIFCSDALAFKLKTHLIIANRSMAAITGPAASATIDVPGFEAIRVYNPEVVEAVRQYPQYYRAGTLGPDAYPDLIGGQLWVHVNKGNEKVEECPPPDNCVPNGVAFEDRQFDHWRSIDNGMYLLKRAFHVHPSPANAEQRRLRYQALAFAYGYLTHMIGDAFAHGYVNEWARAVFNYRDGNRGALYGPPTEELQHMAVEGYIDAHMPAVSDADLAISTPVEFLNAVYLDPVPQPQADRPTKPGAFGGIYFVKLLELRKILDQLSHRDQWASDSWAQPAINAALRIQAAASTLATFGSDIGDPVRDIEDYFRRRREMVDAVLTKWVALSGCVGQNIVLGSNKAPDAIVGRDACAFQDGSTAPRLFEDTPILQDIFGGKLNEAAWHGRGINQFDFGRLDANLKKQELFLRTVLDRGLIFQPSEDIASIRTLKRKVEECDQGLVNFSSCDAACTAAREFCTRFVETSGCLGCPYKNGEYYCDWICKAFHPNPLCRVCAGNFLEKVIDPACTESVNATSPGRVCDFCSRNTICASLDALATIQQDLETFLTGVVQGVIKPMVESAKQEIINHYAPDYVRDFIALSKELERRKVRAKASWFVNIAFLKEDLAVDPDYLNLIFEQMLHAPGRYVNNNLSGAAAVQYTYNAGLQAARAAMPGYMTIDTAISYDQVWRGIVETLYSIRNDPSFELLRRLETPAYDWLDHYRLRADSTPYETRLARFVALMAATDAILGIRGPTARKLRATMNLSADVMDDGAGSIDVDNFHPVTNAIRLTKLGFLGKEGIQELGARAGLTDVSAAKPFGWYTRFFPGSDSRLRHRVSAICRDVPHIACDAIQSLDDPNHYKFDGNSIEMATIPGAATEVDVNRSVSAWASRSSARAGACQLGLTNFLLLANDEVLAKIYRRIFMLPEYCGKPDLIISSMKQTPPYAGVGEDIRFDITVSNIGGAPAPASKLKVSAGLRVSRDGAADSEALDMPALAPGESVEVTKMKRAGFPQVYRNTYRAYFGSAVDELNNANNHKTWDYRVYTAAELLPDLQATALNYSGRPIAGSAVRLTVRVRNAGILPSPLTVLTATVSRIDPPGAARLDSVSVDVPYLLQGRWVDRTLRYTFPEPGKYRVKLQIDPRNQVAESDEENNIFSIDLLVDAPFTIPNSVRIPR